MTILRSLSSYPPAEIMVPKGAPIPLSLAPFIQALFIERDGIRLRVLHASKPDVPPRGTVIITPGRTEFIEKYFETAEEFINRRFTVLIIDHRGQGLSTRLLDDPLKSYVRRFQDYADDLGFIIDELGTNLPKPHILLAHSMGGCIALQSVISGTSKPSAVICSAPMLGLYDLDTPIIRWVLSGLSMLGMSKRNLPFQGQQRGLPVAFKHNKLTSDITRFTRWETYFTQIAALRLAGPTLGWIKAALESMRFVNRNAAQVKTPTLIVAAGGDPIVDPGSNRKFAEKSGAEFKIIPGALHELFLEQDMYRDQFYEAVDSFLEQNAL